MPTRRFTIRPFRDGDQFAICDLHVAAIRAVSTDFYPQELINAWAEGKTPQVYVDMQRDTGEIVLIAADENDRPVGFCGYLGDEVRGLYVDPEWQCKGVGRALMQAAEQALRTAGVTRARVRAAKSAYAFYARIGYTRTDLVTHTTRDGRVMEAAWYEKPLG